MNGLIWFGLGAAAGCAALGFYVIWVATDGFKDTGGFG